MGGGGSKPAEKYSDESPLPPELAAKDKAVLEKKLVKFNGLASGKNLPNNAAKVFSAKDLAKFGSWLVSANAKGKINIYAVLARLPTNLKFYQTLPKKAYPLRPWYDHLDTNEPKVAHAALAALLALCRGGGTSGATPDAEATTKAYFSAQFGYDMTLRYAALFKGDTSVQHTILQILHSALLADAATTTYSQRRKIVELATPLFSHFAELALQPDNPTLRRIATEVLTQLLLQSIPQQTKKFQDQIRTTGQYLYLLRDCFDKNKSKEASALFGVLCNNNVENLSVLGQLFHRSCLKWLDKALPKPKVTTVDEPTGKKKKKKKKSAPIEEAPTLQLFDDLPKKNWGNFFSEFNRNFTLYTLIWNANTRKEFLEKLQDEIHDFEIAKKKVWDYKDFTIHYSCLDGDNQVDGYYISHLVKEADKQKGKIQVADPNDFMMKCYNKCVITDSDEWKKEILQTMNYIFSSYENKFDHNFHHMDYLTWLFGPKHCGEHWAADLTALMNKLFKHKTNVKGFVYAKGVPSTIDKLVKIKPPPKEKAPKTVSAEETGADEATEKADSVEPKDTQKEAQELSGPEAHVSHAANLLGMLQSCVQFKVARKQLATVQNLSYVVQSLLIIDRNIADIIVDMLNKLYKSGQPVEIPLEDVYKTGIFSFLMLYLNIGFTENMCKFLKLSHKVQGGKKKGMGSFLNFFFPDAVIHKLDTLPTAEFTKIINEDSSSPDLYWNTDIREKIVSSCSKTLKRFSGKREEDPTQIYDYEEPMVVELDLGLCINNIYIKLYIQMPDFVLKDPEGLLKAMTDKMDDLKLDELGLVVNATTELFKRFPKKPQFAKFSGFKAFLDKSTKINDVQVLAQIYELFSVILGSGSKDNVSMFFSSGGLETTFKLLAKRDDYKTAPEEQNKFSVQLLKTIDVICTTPDCQKKMVAMDNYYFELSKTFVFKKLDTSLTVAYEALQLINHSLTKELYNNCMGSGILLTLLQIAVFSTCTEDDKSDENKVAIATMTLLTTLYKKIPVAKTVMDMALTKALSKFINAGKGSDFLTNARADREDPLLLWGADYREELQLKLAKELQKAGDKEAKHKAWDPSAFEMKYDAIEEELFVDDVYVSVFNEQNEFKLPDSGSLFKSLLLCMKESCEHTLFDISSVEADKKEAVSIARKTNLFKIFFKYIAKPQPTAFDSVSDADFEQKLIADYKIKLLGLVNLLKAEGGDKHIDKYITADYISTFRDIFRYLTSRSASKEATLLMDLFITFSQSKKASGFMSANSILLTIYHSVFHKSKGFEHKNVKILTCLTNLVNQDLAVVNVINSTGFLVSVLDKFIHKCDERKSATTLLACMSKDSGSLDFLCAMTAKGFRKKFEGAVEDPADLIEYYEDDHETPVIIWTNTTRAEFSAFIDKEIEAITNELNALPYIVKKENVYNWGYADAIKRYSRPSIEKQLIVDGVYLEIYEENLTFKVPDVPTFLNSLMQRISVKYDSYKNIMENEGGSVKSSQQLQTMFNCAGKALKQDKKQVPEYITNHVATVFKFTEPFVESKLKLAVANFVTNTLKEKAAVTAFVSQKGMDNLLKALTAEVTDDNLEVFKTIISLLCELVVDYANIVEQFDLAGGFLYIINILLNSSTDKDIRTLCATLLIQIHATDADSSINAATISDTYLTSKFESKFDESPAGLAKYFLGEHTSGQRTWDDELRAKYRKFISRQFDIWNVQEWDGSARVKDSDVAKLFISQEEEEEEEVKPEVEKPKEEKEETTEETTQPDDEAKTDEADKPTEETTTA